MIFVPEHDGNEVWLGWLQLLQSRRTPFLIKNNAPRLAPTRAVHY